MEVNMTKEQKSKLIRSNEEPIGVAMEKYEIESEKMVKDKALNRLDVLEKEAIERKQSKKPKRKYAKKQKEN